MMLGSGSSAQFMEGNYPTVFSPRVHLCLFIL